MNKTSSAMAAVIASSIVAMSGRANADVLWTINSTFTDGATVTGTFDTDVYGYVHGYDLTTTAGGVFTGFEYTPGDSYAASGPNFVDFEPGYQADLHLEFVSPLTTSGSDAIDASTSYECQGSYSCYVPSGGDIRYLAATQPGGGSPVASGAPEPMTWALMLIGVGAIGFATRRRTRAASLSV